MKNLNSLYNDTYTEQNLIISGTHSHSTPGGYLMDLMLDIPCLGFVQETFDAYVNGITQVKHVETYFYLFIEVVLRLFVSWEMSSSNLTS